MSFNFIASLKILALLSGKAKKQSAVSRVVTVSSEISGGKFPEIYSKLTGNFLHNFFTLCV